HITHRCHNHEFLFRYKKYRQFYLRHLFEMQKRYRIDVLDYIVTSNHVHLLLTASKGKRISEGLRYLNGRVAQFYNLQTGKSGGFWGDRFHSTLIQDGDIEQFRKWHRLTLDGMLKQGKKLQRETYWSKAYAVGDKEWVKTKLQHAGIKRMSVLTAEKTSYAIGVI
ncbi:MAG: transposase, partial [Caldisericia bacterium]|nr:transposase [Caldisericia bacterium]